MAENKIIFTGPVGVGKTTAIAALSDDPPIKTDARASDMTTSMKSHTTVAMDYGVIHLDEKPKCICTVRLGRNALILCGIF